MTSQRRVSLIGEWAESAAPPPALTVSQWADANRLLPKTSGARGGPWKTATTPYLRGIMDAIHEPGVRTIALKKCHQSGGSESLHNILAYFIVYDPSPMLFVHPTADVAESWSKERLADIIASTPALAKMVRTKRQPRGSQDAESTLSLKMFPGGFLALGGANTPNTFARWSVRIAIGDDVDRFPAVVGEEGDPAELLVNRTTTFHDALVLFVSTPTLKGGRIDTLYERSDQRRYVVPCPRCGRLDWITWSDPNHLYVVYDREDPRTARLACPDDEHGGCGAMHDEPTRREMVAAGSWEPTAAAQETGLVGFHLPAMISTLGVTLQGLVEKWLGARAKGKESLRVFINTSLAEGWEDRSARRAPDPLYARREFYGQDAHGADIEVPAAAVALTCGVDVQENRFELLVTAWGAAEERWIVEAREIPGRPELDVEVWGALLEALKRKYLHASGHQLPIHATCIDSGYATEKVYSFVLAHQARRIYATKGIAGRGGEPIVGKATEKRHGKSPLPIRLWPINVDDAKAALFESLDLATSGPGYVHFPESLENEFFAQLCAEHKEPRYNKQNVATHSVWVQDRERNEALDMAVLCLAAVRLLKPNIRQMLETLAATPLPSGVTPIVKRPPVDTPMPASPRQQPQVPRGRRVSFSPFLER